MERSCLTRARGRVASRVPRRTRPDADAAGVVGVVEGGDLHLDGAVVELGGGDEFDDGVEQGLDGVARILGEVADGPAVASGGVEDGEVELVVGGAEFDEEVEDFVEDFVVALGGLVDLVEDDDGLEAELEGLVEDEAGLGHGAFGGVDEQQDAVGHVEDAFDLPAEVGVAGGVDDVDFDALVADGDVLGEDGDAAFAFEVVAVEQAVLAGGLALGDVELAQDGVDEGGFAVVDVGDDGDVADVGDGVHSWRSGFRGQRSGGAGET
jgi:hypothetical protein